MPFSRPTLTDLRTQAAQDIGTALPGADALLRFSNLGVVGDVLAGLAHLHYGYLDWIALQAVPYTATDEFLEAWAGLVGIIRKPATAAGGTATFTGAAGTLLPAGTGVVRGDGVAYTTAADGTVGGDGTATVAVTADIAGAAGNADALTIVTLGAAIAGIQSNGTLATACTGGADAEADDDLRGRMLERYQAPPQGGDAQDYVTWALDVAGVTRAWTKPNGQGVGTVIVYFMMDEAESAHSGFPQGTDGVATDESRDTPATGDQLAVANAIFGVQPVTALVYAVAPVALAQNFTISGLSGAGSSVQGAVKAAIADVFTREATPGGVTLPGGTAGGTTYLSHIESAIAGVPGVGHFVITSPTADITVGAGQLSTLGTVTFT